MTRIRSSGSITYGILSGTEPLSAAPRPQHAGKPEGLPKDAGSSLDFIQKCKPKVIAASSS